MKRLMWLLCLGCFLGAWVSSGNVIVLENFNGFADGPVTNGASWTAFSGGDGSITVSSGIVNLGSGAEDVERDFGEQTGTLFAGIDVTVSTAAASDYVMGFRDGSSLSTRIFLDDVTGGYQLGVNSGGTGSSTAGAFASNTLLIGQTYRVVFAYDQVSLVRAWIDPTPTDEASPDVQFTNADASGLDAFFFRQGGGWDNGAASWQADNLLVSDTFSQAIPEPSVFGLIGLGTLVAAVRRRR